MATTMERLAIDGGTPVRTRPFGPGHDYGDDDLRELEDVIRSGSLGPRKVREVERAWAEKNGTAHAIAVNSGTSAMHACVAAINPDPGDEFIVTPWTSCGSVIGVLYQNCIPVFADVDASYCIDPADVARKITPRTRGVIAVHMFGNPCEMDALREICRRHGIFLIEDACQAQLAEYQGRQVGTFGDITGYSFSGKHISTGAGGFVVTNNRQLWERAFLFTDDALPRTWNAYAGRRYATYFLGLNYKMNDLTAAVVLAQLRKVDGYVERKIAAARRLTALLADIPEIVPQPVRPGDRHTYWNYGFTIDDRALGVDAFRFAKMVTAEGVPLAGPYVGSGREGPLYRNPFLADQECFGRSRHPFDYQRERPVDYRLDYCAFGEALFERNCNLGMRQSFTDDDVSEIATAIRKVVDHCRANAARA